MGGAAAALEYGSSEIMPLTVAEMCRVHNLLILANSPEFGGIIGE